MDENTALVRVDEAPLATRQEAGQAANRAAARYVFADYRVELSENTLRAQSADLTLFAQYFAHVGTLPAYPQSDEERQEWAERYAAPLWSTPEAWSTMTWGYVQGFKAWLSQKGQAVASINRALSTVRKYAELAGQAGAIDNNTYQLIRTVKGYRNATNVDERRETSRVGGKKADWARIPPAARARLLSAHEETAQGLRDAFLMALLLEHGLRVSEASALKWSDVVIEAGLFTVHRKKTSKKTKHLDTLEFTDISRRALERYRACFDFYEGPLLRAINKGGRLQEHGMSTSAINQRVKALGALHGVEGLSPHDCRHDWATRAVRGTKNLLTVQQAGGWRSLAMVQRYADRQKIANKGLKLEDTDE